MEETDIGSEQPPGVSARAWRVIAAAFTLNLMAIGVLLMVMTGVGSDQLEAVMRHLPEPVCMHVCDGEAGGGD